MTDTMPQWTLVIHSPPGSPRLKQSHPRYCWGDRGRREMAGAHPLRSFLTRGLSAPTLLALASFYPTFLLVNQAPTFCSILTWGLENGVGRGRGKEYQKVNSKNKTKQPPPQQKTKAEVKIKNQEIQMGKRKRQKEKNKQTT